MTSETPYTPCVCGTWFLGTINHADMKSSRDDKKAEIPPSRSVFTRKEPNKTEWMIRTN